MHPRARPIGEPLGDNVLMNFGQDPETAVREDRARSSLFHPVV